MNTPITFANLTPETFLTLLKRAVDKRGEDYVYPYHQRYGGLCCYSYAGEPSCIIGEVIHSIDPDMLPSEDLIVGARPLLVRLGVTNEIVLIAAGKAQSLQDNDCPWGEAYEGAVKCVNNLMADES